MNLALIGYGSVGKAFARLLEKKHSQYPFRIVAIHTARQGSAYGLQGLPVEPKFGPKAGSIEEFLDRSQAEVIFEISALNPSTGEPAISHIRAAFARGLSVVTANKGPIAHAWAALEQEARMAGVQFRFEATVMDGAPVFSFVRETLPGIRIEGFTGVLNSTTGVVLRAMEDGKSFEEGVEAARRLGITEADPAFDTDGWDAAAKTAALANVLMNARCTPMDVDTKGVTRITPDKMAELKAKGKTIRLVSRAHQGKDGLKMRVRAEVLEATDTLATARGTSNILLLETDCMGTLGIFESNPGVEQTAYGLFSDLVDIAKTI